MTSFRPLFLREGRVLIGLFLVRVAAAQTVYTPAWSSYVGGDFDTDGVRAIAADAAANTYLGGFLGQGWIQSANGVADPPFFSGRDGFVAKVAPGGALAWYVCLGDYENDTVQGVAAGTNGALYAVGASERSDLDDVGTDAFLTSLSAATGSNLWSHTVGGLNGTNGFNAVATDASGFIYAVGYTTLAGQLCNVPGYQVGGTNYGTEWKGNTDALVVKWAPNGTVLWRHYLGGLNADAATACAVAPDGSVYVGGETRSPGWATLPSGAPSPASPDGFLVKLTATGAHVWSAFLGGSAADALSALSVNPLTGALFAGGTTSSSDFLAAAPRLNALAGATDGFVLKLTDTNTAFRTEWCRFLGGSAADSVTALAAQPNGSVSAGGTTSTNGWLTQTGGTAFGGVTDGFVCSLFGDGSPDASAYVGGERRDELYALATVSNALFAAGCTLSTNWVSGGFWTTWNKYEDFGAGDFGFVAKWTAPQASQPSITAEPSDLTVQEDQPATFSVTAAGTAPLFYQWRRNGVLIAGAMSNAYVLASAALSNSNDRFTCLVSNVLGTAASREAVLTVTPKPHGTLTVALGPAEAAALGAAWSVDGGASWLAGGASTNLAAGLYVVTFRPVAGYTPPDALADVPVASGQTTSRSATYTVSVPPKGTLTVALGPAEAAALGAAWSVDGGASWLAGGASTNLEAGLYAVTFRPVAGYTPPDALADVPVASGQTTSRSASYTLIPEPVFATRAIAGSAVIVTVRPPAGTSFWQVTELLPQGLTPATFPGCAWDPETRTLTYVASGTNQATISYSVSATNGLYAIEGVLDYVKAHDVYSSPVSGDTLVVLANVWRQVAGTSVTVTLVPPATTVFVWSVEESLPAGLTPLNVAGPGASWDAATRKLTWVLLGNTGATLTYDVAGAPGTYSLAGRATFGGPYEPVFGDSALTVPGTPPVVPAPTLLSLTPDPAAGRCLLTFVSVANQAYAVQTNAALNASAWADCLWVTGAPDATVSELPMAGPRLFYRVRVLE